MEEMTCCRKFLVYFFLALNIFITIVILLLLFLATYDIKLLDWYQYIYLILAIIVWLLLFVVYVGKLVLIIIKKLIFPSKYLKLAWIILNGIATIFFIIGFIFDLVMYSQGEISYIVYNVIYWLILVLYGIFTGFDFFLINSQIELSGNKFNETQVKVANEDIKTYQEHQDKESVNVKIKTN